MFKKIVFILGWAILLCFMLLISVVIATWTDSSLYVAVVLWLVQVFVLLLFRAIWIGMGSAWQKRKLSRLYKALQFSRKEHVLFERWKTGAAVIKLTRRRRENIPWYILVGERCGKTTLMATAKLPLMSHQPESDAVVPTRTLQWWFFKTAGFLDLSSYFLLTKPAALSTWRRLTTWCTRIAPPSGVVVCISCRDLQTGSKLELHQQARKLRAQLEILMKSVRRKLPIHIILTESDHIQGFTLWARQLTPNQNQQALGYCWQHYPIVDRQDISLLDPLFISLKQGLDLSRISMLSGSLPDASTRILLDLPQNISQIQYSLHHYIAALFEPDAYYANGLLAGIWFAASIESEQQHQKRDALFVQDLINKVLPENSKNTLCQAYGVRSQWLTKWLKPLLATAMTVVLLFSAWQTWKLMGPVNSRGIEMLSQHINKNEKWMTKPLVYLPFLPLLNHRHQFLEDELMRAAKDISFNKIDPQLQDFRRRFYLVEPALKRQMIVELAHSILIRQAMIESQPLVVLAGLAATSPLLHITTALPHHSEITRLAVERAYLRSEKSVPGIVQMQSLLRELVASDSHWRWLVADDSQLNGLRVTHFWPHSNNNVELSGLWLAEGQQKMASQLDIIQRASGAPQPLPAINAFWKQWPHLRQEAWLEFLFAMAKEETLKPGMKANVSQLMALDKGLDPVTVFIRRTQRELADIHQSDTTPWLSELRRINLLIQTPGLFPRLQSIDNKEKRMRSALRRWLYDDVPAVMVNSREIESWMSFQTSLKETINHAMSASVLTPVLTEGLFDDNVTQNVNPLKTLYLTYAHLRKEMAQPENSPGRGAVWALLENQLMMLTANAMATSACWVEHSWQSEVLKPLGHRAEQRNPQQQQEKASRYFSDFLQGTVKKVMRPTLVGLRPGEFRGLGIPFTADFIHIVNHVVEPDDILLMPERGQTRTHDELTLLEKQIAQRTAQRNQLISPLQVEVASLPATVPGGALLMPVGTRLDLHCANKSWQLDSNNLYQESQFDWTPGQCNSVTLTVKFPGSELKYRYLGESAWHDFVADFDQGERRFELQEFMPESIHPLSGMHIKEVLVRYQLKGQQAVIERWQQWLELTNEIALLQTRYDEQQDLQTHRQQPRYFEGALTTLPTSVATCTQ